MVNTAKIFADNLKAARKRQKYTQENLAEMIGLVPHTIQGYEVGRSWPSAEILDAICEALKISPDQLFIDKNAEKPLSPLEALDVVKKLIESQQATERAQNLLNKIDKKSKDNQAS